MPSKHPMKISMQTPKQIALADLKARNRKTTRSRLVQRFFDSLPLHPISKPEKFTLTE